MTKKKRICISLPQEQYDHVVRMCNLYGCTKSEYFYMMTNTDYALQFFKKYKRKR